TASLFVSHQLTAEAADRYAKDKEPWLATPLVSAIVITSSNGTSGDLLAKRIEALPVEDRDLQLQIADAFLRLKLPEQAAAWYRKALASSRPNIKVAAARGLAMCGAGAEAAPLLAEHIKARPHEALNDMNLIIAVAKTGDTTAIDSLTKILTDGALH